MSKRSSFLSLPAILFAIYVGGPLLWLLWMVFNSRIIHGGEALRVLAAPLTIATLTSFLAINGLVLGRGLRALPRMADAPARFTRPERAAAVDRLLWFHLGSLAAFGLFGTLASIQALAADPWAIPPLFGAPPEALRAWSATLLGCGLTLTFFVPFTAVLARTLEAAARLDPRAAGAEPSRSARFVAWGIAPTVLGTALIVSSAVVAAGMRPIRSPEWMAELLRGVASAAVIAVVGALPNLLVFRRAQEQLWRDLSSRAPGWIEGRYCLVTGATSGIGRATAEELVRRGARVGLVARRAEAGRAAAAEIAAATGRAAPDVFACDLSDLDAVRRLAAEVRERWPSLHVLVQNAGIYCSDRRTTPQGLEVTFVVNYLSRFLLARLLHDRLAASAPSRIVEVAGMYHARGALHWDDLQLAKGYSADAANAQSKLANVVFTRELARRVAGQGITVNCLHPGAVDSGALARNPETPRWQIWFARAFFKSPAGGAVTPVFLATDADVAAMTGGYFVNRRLRQPATQAVDARSAERLWSVSEALCREASAGLPS